MLYTPAMQPPPRDVAGYDAPDLVSVLIPVRNGVDVLGDQLAALSRQTYAGAWEVLVADNGSTDGTPELARSYADRLPDLRVLDASARPGANHARNAAAEAARGALLACCDGDDVADERWLEELVRASRHAPFLGGQLRVDTLNPREVRGWRPDPPAHGLHRFEGFLPFAVGANLAIRTELFRSLGGFHRDYPTGDDVELALRAKARGISVTFAGDAVMHYRYRGGPRDLYRQSIGYGVIAPHLRHDYPDAMPRSSLGDAARAWLRLARRLPAAALRPERRGPIARGLGLRVGRLRGSVRYRVLYP